VGKNAILLRFVHFQYGWRAENASRWEELLSLRAMVLCHRSAHHGDIGIACSICVLLERSEETMLKRPIARDSEGANVHSRVQSQFGAAAAAYNTSLVHSDPNALRRVVELAQPQPGDAALDIATGTGHTALALAPHVASVVAFDLTEKMLTEAARNAADRGLKNVFTRLGMAEDLPFADSSFDIVTVRQAPHHYVDVLSAVREMARVARPGARVIVVDSTAPEDASVGSRWNYIEKLRDRSHVRNYTPTEWREMITATGLHIFCEEIDFCTENGQPMDFRGWVKRMNTPSADVEELAQLFREADSALTSALRIQIEGDRIRFCVPQITIGSLKK
jgi:ubiquinone/menaquinone biosynthesis C-methylase UbiE